MRDIYLFILIITIGVQQECSVCSRRLGICRSKPEVKFITLSVDDKLVFCLGKKRGYVTVTGVVTGKVIVIVIGINHPVEVVVNIVKNCFIVTQAIGAQFS